MLPGGKYTLKSGDQIATSHPVQEVCIFIPYLLIISVYIMLTIHLLLSKC